MSQVKEFFLHFTMNSGLLYIIIAVFLVGLFMGTVQSFIYENVIDQMHRENGNLPKRLQFIMNEHWEHKREVAEIRAFIANHMHEWKCCNMYVEQMGGITNICGYLVAILGMCGVGTVVLSMTNEYQGILNLELQNVDRFYIKTAMVYAVFSMSLYAGLKIWNQVLMVKYKIIRIQDQAVFMILQFETNGAESQAVEEKGNTETKGNQEIKENEEVKKDEEMKGNTDTKENVMQIGEKRKQRGRENENGEKELTFIDEILNEYLG